MGIGVCITQISHLILTKCTKVDAGEEMEMLRRDGDAVRAMPWDLPRATQPVTYMGRIQSQMCQTLSS